MSGIFTEAAPPVVCALHTAQFHELRNFIVDHLIEEHKLQTIIAVDKIFLDLALSYTRGTTIEFTTDSISKLRTLMLTGMKPEDQVSFDTMLFFHIGAYASNPHFGDIEIL